MKTVKAKLTELKNLIDKKINKEYRWLGEVTSPQIIKEIEQLYPLIEKIEKSEKSLEISYAKYIALQLIKKATRIINKTRDTNTWDRYDLNSFVLSLIKLRMTIKELYLIEIKGELRTEEERQAIAADITKIKENLSEHIALETQLIEDKKELAELKQALDNLQNSFEDTQSQTEEISEWHTKTDSLTDEIIDWHKTAADQSKSIQLLFQQSELDKPKIATYKKELEEMRALFKKQREDIQEIIEDANRASMAGSFKKQQDEINKKMRWADGFLIGSLIITAVISLWGFSSSFVTPQNLLEPTFFNWSQFLAKSAISLPFLIVAWIKAKERAYLFRLREDYGYKYSSAMAFEGYRKQVQEQSPELEQQLLQIAVDNLGSNPTKVFDKDLKSTPIETFMDEVGKRIDKAVDGIKGQVKDIPQKTKELMDE